MSKIIFHSKNESGLLWNKLLQRLKEVEESAKYLPNKRYISFPEVFLKICRSNSITKKSAWECLFFLQEFGLIEISCGHGVRLKYEIKNDKK